MKQRTVEYMVLKKAVLCYGLDDESIQFLKQYVYCWGYCYSLVESSGSRSEAIAALPYFTEGTFTPLWLSQSAVELDNLHSIPNFSLTDQNGQTVTEKTFEDKIYITDFFLHYMSGNLP